MASQAAAAAADFDGSKPTPILVMATQTCACDFKPMKMERRPLGDNDVLMRMVSFEQLYDNSHRPLGYSVKSNGADWLKIYFAALARQHFSERMLLLFASLGGPTLLGSSHTPLLFCLPQVACGICHSDLHIARGDIEGVAGKVVYPIVPGHELAGVCVAVGSKVTKFSVGDHVGVGCMVDACLQCKECRK